MRYKPIACHLYDILEILAIAGQVVTIRYDKGDRQVTISQRIKDLQTMDGKEYLVTDKDATIRLDKLIAVNEHLFIVSQDDLQ